MWQWWGVVARQLAVRCRVSGVAADGPWMRCGSAVRGQSCPSEGSVGRLTRPLNSASGMVLEEVLSEIRVQCAPPAHFSRGCAPLVEMHSRLNSCATGDLRNINAALCVAASSHRPPLMPVTLLPGEGLGAATPDNAPATTAGEPTGSQGRSAQSWTAAARGPKLRGCPLAPPRADDALGGTARDRADRGTGTGDHDAATTRTPPNTRGSYTEPKPPAPAQTAGHRQRCPAWRRHHDAHAAAHRSAS